MNTKRLALQFLLLALGFLLSISVLNRFSGWWPYAELWILPIFFLSFLNSRTSIWLAIVFGWIVNIYSPALNGQPVLVLPLAVGLLVFVNRSWGTHRIWVRAFGILLLGTFLYHFLGLAYQFIAEFAFGEGSMMTRALDTVRSFPLHAAMNLFFGFLLFRVYRYAFSEKVESRYVPRLQSF